MSDLLHSPFVEKYRPSKWSAVIGQDKVIGRIQALAQRGSLSGRAFIVNEAHGLRKDVIRQLLVTLERIPAHVVWVFTTTVEGQESLFEDYNDASPLLSRCLRLDLSRRNLAKAFAARAQEIAKSEGLDGAPFGKYLQLVENCRNNFRAMLQAIEGGEMLTSPSPSLNNVPERMLCPWGWSPRALFHPFSTFVTEEFQPCKQPENKSNRKL
jgi:hypothetical protein